MIVHHDPDAGVLYLDLSPGTARPSQQTAARDVTIDLTVEGTCAGLRLSGVSAGLPPTAQTALLRYCPELVGGQIRPDWEAVRLHLLIEAGALPPYPVRAAVAGPNRLPEPVGVPATAPAPTGHAPARHGLGGIARALRHPRRGGAAA